MSDRTPTFFDEVERGLKDIQTVRRQSEGAIKQFLVVIARTHGVDANDARALAALRARLDKQTQDNWTQFETLVAQFDKIDAAVPKILHALRTTACCDLSEFDATAVYPLFSKGTWPMCSLLDGVPNKRSCGRCRIRIFWSQEALQVHLSESASAVSLANNV